MKLHVALTQDQPPASYSIRQIEELFQITYLKKLTFNDWETEQWIRKKCARAMKRGKIGQLAHWLGKYHQNDLASGRIPNIVIRWIHEQIGYGLFTLGPLKKWEYIGEYTGLLRRRPILFPSINDYCFMYPREWFPRRAYTIDSEKQGNYTRFINHSDTPNCESVSIYYDGVFHILFRTIKDIPAGEELTYDYGSIYWLRRKKLKINEPIEKLVPAEAIPADWRTRESNEGFN